jgi:hypothetical protein
VVIWYIFNRFVFCAEKNLAALLLSRPTVRWMEVDHRNPTMDGRRPGVDVMIKIFCNFGNFSAQKIGVFLENQCYDQNFASFSFVFSQKRHFFAEIFGENI